MDQKIVQKIHECSICGETPEDGEPMWYMGVEIWCEKCANKESD